MGLHCEMGPAAVKVEMRRDGMGWDETLPSSNLPVEGSEWPVGCEDKDGDCLKIWIWRGELDRVGT